MLSRGSVVLAMAMWSLARAAGSLLSEPVYVTNGWIQGQNKLTHIEYLGVPYATVTKRFQAAGPEPTWEETKLFTKSNIICTQRTILGVKGTEDCLALNVYTPVQVSADLRPVMVFIHGGGFRDGSGSPFLYGPEHFVKHDVILISMNYRVEVLGFLCLGIKEAPGNIGMKDQVAGLKWVRRNIRQFGGDPDNITIFGESAGGASIMYHMISPMSKGLFQKAIIQSGSAIAYWSFQFEPLKIATALAKSLGYNTKDPEEIFEIFLNKTDVELLSSRVPRKKGDMFQSESIFVPCVEKNIPGVEPFLLDTPFNVMSSGNYTSVPLIVGHNSNEGYYFVGKENDTTIAQFNFFDALPRDLEFGSVEEKNKTAQEMRELYMGDKEITNNHLRLSEYEGDAGVTFPATFDMELLAKTSTEPVYAYKFSYSGTLNFAKFISGFLTAPGASHADELFYMFKISLPTLLLDITERKIIGQMTTMWTNFARDGQPVPQASESLHEWPPLDKADLRLLNIDKKITMQPVWANERLLFWNDTYTSYRKKSIT